MEIESPISSTRARPGWSTTGANAGLCGLKSLACAKAGSAAIRRIDTLIPEFYAKSGHGALKTLLRGSEAGLRVRRDAREINVRVVAEGAEPVAFRGFGQPVNFGFDGL